MNATHRQEPEAVDVIARPPLLFLGCLIVGLILDWLLPLPLPEAVAPGRAVGGALILLGLTILVAGILNFARASTPVPSTQPVRAVVTTGIHGWSRNPIYVGMFLIYGGIAIAAASTWALILLVPLAIVIHYGVVAREEAYLERRFGDAYRDYKARVRRWL